MYPDSVFCNALWTVFGLLPMLLPIISMLVCPHVVLIDVTCGELLVPVVGLKSLDVLLPHR